MASRISVLWLRLQRKKWHFLGVLVLLVGALGWGGCKMAPRYDELVGLNENVAKEWAGVETQLQRRYDLIPNLIEVAKGAAAHESAVFLALAGGHTSYQSARNVSDRIEASYRTEAALRQVPFVVRQTFPVLQSSRRFAEVMRSMEKTEDMILKQRLRYNEAVATFNSRQKSLEGRLVSLFGRFEPAVYYNPPEASQQRIEVSAPSSGPLLEVKAGVEVATAQDAGPKEVEAAPDAGTDAGFDAGKVQDLASLYVVKGVMVSGGTREAVVVGPGGESLNLSAGMVLPRTHARVVAVDATGVTLEDRGPDGKAPPKQIRLR